MNLKKAVYRRFSKRCQSSISKTKYALRLKPRVNRHVAETNSGSNPYPLLYKAGVVFSADFELAWGWNHAKNSADPVAHALEMARQTRENFPVLLDLFQKYETPVTWATVGHLFLSECAKSNGKIHPEIVREPHFINTYWSYEKGDWFDDDPVSSVLASPEWYAPDLIQQIIDSPVDHEIGCHSFSHIDFSDQHCPQESAESELNECVRLANQRGLKLDSFVFPGNLVGNLNALKNTGFSSYRYEGPYELDFPRKDSLGLWQIPGGICLEKPPLGWSNEYWVGILKKYVDTALETGTVCHFWFHPSIASNEINGIMEPLLQYLSSRRDKAWMTTMSSLTKWLEQRTGR